MNIYNEQQIAELCSKLHESVVKKEEMISNASSHTADRRQYLMQLLCLSPGNVFVFK
jgi:hypothetical protein